MFADTEAIRSLGAASAAHAADLAAVAATLSSLPLTSPTLGPVAAQFLTALADAAADESRAVAALVGRLSAAGRTAHTAATAYDDADLGAGRRIAEV